MLSYSLRLAKNEYLEIVDIETLLETGYSVHVDIRSVDVIGRQAIVVIRKPIEIFGESGATLEDMIRGGIVQ